jgi:hypothetical protein
MKERLFCVLHVPKCAGSTIEGHLHKSLASDAFWKPPKRTRRFPLELLGRKYDQRLPGPAESIRAISGHFIGASIEHYFPDRSIKRVILLRRPADLLLSWYNFRMMRYIANGLAPYSFKLHLRSMPPDPVAHFLLERWLELPLWKILLMSTEKKAKLLDETLSTFDFIGDIGDCDRLVESISRELQIEQAAERANTEEGWRNRVAWNPLRYANLTDDYRSMIAELTALDEYLWRRWALKEDVSFDARCSERQFIAHGLRRPYYELQRRYWRAWRDYNQADWEMGAGKL